MIDPTPPRGGPTDPFTLDALCQRAEELRLAGRHAEAIPLAVQVVAADPGHAPALYALGSSLLQLGQTREAVERLRDCAALRPDDPAVHNNLGLALAGERRIEEAVRAYDRALALRPAYARAFSNRGLARIRLNDFGRALADLDAALALDPKYAAALVNRGLALAGQGRNAEALESYQRAFPAPQALANASALLRDLNRVREALDCVRRLIDIAPDLDEALGMYHMISQHAADWDDYDTRVRRIVGAQRAGRRPATPFIMLSVADSPEDQRLAAEAYARTLAVGAPLWRGERYRHTRLRVAYLSADFHDHATSYLAVGLFEQHDRERFEVYALSYGWNTDGPMRERLLGAFEHFEDVRRLTDRELATLIRDEEIDILIDLKGYTADNRFAVLAHRPAPLQVHYLGYPGTLGTPWLDYLISDPTVVPSNERAHYSEHLITLPGCYQVNDDRRSIEADPGDRAAWTLPDDALVLCAFHPTYKLNPALFDIWMRVLRRLDDACLWLLSEDPEPQVRLRAEAAKRNVDPQRLVFARRVAPGLHLARHKLADLYLDAWPYNAHTSASDALWAGLPVIAIEGRSFAARVSSSILRAAGLDAWIARSLDEYESLIIALGTDRRRLDELRAGLQRDTAGSPLFNSLAFTRTLEEALTLIHQRHEAGLPPGSIEVPTWSRTDRTAVRDCRRP